MMNTQNSDPIQQQLIDAQRNQILDTAITVFAEKGFHKATIKDVAKVAKVADGTIYNYFENKTALVLGILDRLNESGNGSSISPCQSIWIYALSFVRT